MQAHVANMINTWSPASQPQSRSQERNSVDMIVIVSRLQNGQPLAACQSGLGFSDLTQLEINWGSQPWGFRGVCVCVWYGFLGSLCAQDVTVTYWTRHLKLRSCIMVDVSAAACLRRPLVHKSRSDNVMLSELYAPTEPQSKNLWSDSNSMACCTWHLQCNGQGSHQRPDAHRWANNKFGSLLG